MCYYDLDFSHTLRIVHLAGPVNVRSLVPAKDVVQDVELYGGTAVRTDSIREIYMFLPNNQHHCALHGYKHVLPCALCQLLRPRVSRSSEHFPNGFDLKPSAPVHSRGTGCAALRIMLVTVPRGMAADARMKPAPHARDLSHEGDL